VRIGLDKRRDARGERSRSRLPGPRMAEADANASEARFSCGAAVSVGPHARQTEMAILNLTVNARDAMSEGAACRDGKADMQNQPKWFHRSVE
jgi:hypothetical protein